MGGSYAENNGANAAQCDKLGGYAANSRTAAYTQHVVPWEAVRSLAGFEVTPNTYYISRALIVPDEELQKMIFPKLENSYFELVNTKDEIAGFIYLF